MNTIDRYFRFMKIFRTNYSSLNEKDSSGQNFNNWGFNLELLKNSHLFEVNSNISKALQLTENEKSFYNQPFNVVAIIPNDLIVKDEDPETGKSDVNVALILVFPAITTFPNQKTKKTIAHVDYTEENIFNLLTKNFKPSPPYTTVMNELIDTKYTIKIEGKEEIETFCSVVGMKKSFDNWVDENERIFYIENQIIYFYFTEEKNQIDNAIECVVGSNHFFTNSKFNLDANEDNQKVFNFCSNFFDFLNNPEVTIKTKIPNEEKNIRKINLGKTPFPIRTIIHICGKLKVYLDTFEKQEKLYGFSHRFWVRGHFRRLFSNKFVNKKGTKIWILPYIKGSGILIEKTYFVKKKVNEELS